jgi:hypothetical protein
MAIMTSTTSTEATEAVLPDKFHTVIQLRRSTSTILTSPQQQAAPGQQNNKKLHNLSRFLVSNNRKRLRGPMTSKSEAAISSMISNNKVSRDLKEKFLRICLSYQTVRLSYHSD